MVGTLQCNMVCRIISDFVNTSYRLIVTQSYVPSLILLRLASV